jgi:hypothetical protein
MPSYADLTSSALSHIITILPADIRNLFGTSCQGLPVNIMEELLPRLTAKT